MIRILPETGCWEFSGSKDSHGYGRLFISGKEWKAQRAAYEVFVGPLPPRARLLHPLSPKNCIGAACCNPSHMKLQAPLSRVISGEKRCSKGHLINSLNNVIERRGERIFVRCRICRKAAWRESKKSAHFFGGTS